MENLDFLSMQRRTLSFLTAAFLCLCAMAGLGGSARAQTAQALDAGAQIHITVAGVPELNGNYTIDDAGEVSLLYVNQVHLAGLTPADAAALLASKQYLAKYYRRPQVIVTLLAAGGAAVEVTGAVAGQGSRLIRSDAHLNEVMQQAGPAVDADLTKVQITHGLPGMPHTVDTANYLSFLNSQDEAGNPNLRNGDVIYVPRKEEVQILVDVRGEVAKPGRVSVPAKTTVSDVIQAAGGLLVDADRQGIILQRAITGDQVPFDYEIAQRQPDNISVNPVLRDGDAIIVKAAAQSNQYTITGAVGRPGEYPLMQSHLSLADAIGKAGGTGDRPQWKNVVIYRALPGGHGEAIQLDATDPTVRASTLILPGDNIVIPQGKAGTHYDPLTLLGAAVGIFRFL